MHGFDCLACLLCVGRPKYIGVSCQLKMVGPCVCLSSDVPWSLAPNCDQITLCRFYHNPSTGLIDDFEPAQSWDWVINVNQVGSPGVVGLVGNYHTLRVASSGYWLRDALDVGQRLPNGGQCVLRSVWDCCCVHRWVSCLFDEVGRIPVTLKHFVKVVFLAFRATGVLQRVGKRECVTLFLTFIVTLFVIWMSQFPSNSPYINGQQSHFLLSISITPPEDELQQQRENSWINTLALKKPLISGCLYIR